MDQFPGCGPKDPASSHLYLDIRLTSKLDSPTVLDEFNNLNRGVILVAVKPNNLIGGELVEESGMLSNPSPSEVILPALGHLDERIDLLSRFPDLDKNLEQSEVLLFWSYQLKPTDGPPFERQGGWLSIPSWSGNAVEPIAQSPGGIEFLVEHFPIMTGEARFQSIQVFSRLDLPPVPAIEAALLADDVSVAAYALMGASKPGIEARLSPEARAELDRWRADPECRFYQMNFGSDGGTHIHSLETILEAINDNDAKAARLYFRTLEWLGTSQQHDPQLLADPQGVNRIRSNALRGLLSCVEAYRQSRGRTEPLPDYVI